MELIRVAICPDFGPDSPDFKPPVQRLAHPDTFVFTHLSSFLELH